MTVAGPTNETAMVGVSTSGSLFYAPLIGPPMTGTEGWSPPCPTNELVGRSTDLGATWTQLNPAGPRTSGCVPAFMSVDPHTSRIWFPTTPFPGTLPYLACGAHIAWSDDNGSHWTTGADIPCPSQGEEKLLEGPLPASGRDPVGYPHVVYYCANQAEGLAVQILWCYKSLDGAQTFAFTGSHPDPPPATGYPNQTARPGVAGTEGVLVRPTIECGSSAWPSAATRVPAGSSSRGSRLAFKTCCRRAAQLTATATSTSPTADLVGSPTS